MRCLLKSPSPPRALLWEVNARRAPGCVGHGLQSSPQEQAVGPGGSRLGAREPAAEPAGPRGSPRPGASQTLVPVLLLLTPAELLPAPSVIPPDPLSTLRSTSQKCEELGQLSPALGVNLSSRQPSMTAASRAGWGTAVPSAHSVNHCSPPPLQPRLSLRFMSCASRKHGAGGAEPWCQLPRSHSSHRACSRSTRSQVVPLHLPSPLWGPGHSCAAGSRHVPALASRGARYHSQGSWEEANTPPPLLTEPTGAPSAGADAGACSKAAPAWIGKCITYGLLSRGCPFLCWNRCLA